MSPDALALLDGAASVLRASAGTLSGEARYTALLCANAIATASREAEAGSDALSDNPALRDAIRAGVHDGDAALHARLLASAAVRAWIADPDALLPRERTLMTGEAR